MSQELQEVLSLASEVHLTHIGDFFEVSGVSVLLDGRTIFVLSHCHSHILIAIFEECLDIFFTLEAFLGRCESIKTSLLGGSMFLHEKLHDILEHHLFAGLLLQRHHICRLGFKLLPHIICKIVVISDLFLHLCDLILQGLHVWIRCQLLLGLLELLREVLLPLMGFSQKRGLLIDTLNLILELMQKRKLKLFGLLFILFDQSLILSFQFGVSV